MSCSTPFFGTGTTGAVARRLGRSFIGVERDSTYAAAALKRIAKVTPLNSEALEPLRSKRQAPRVAFGSLVEQGLIETRHQSHRCQGTGFRRSFAPTAR